MQRYIDIHSHLNDDQFDIDRSLVIQKLHEANVSTITVGTDLLMSKKAIAIAEETHQWATVGIHPTDKHDEPYVKEIFEELAAHPRVVAIGECGIDLYRVDHVTNEELNRQRTLFEEQMLLAIKTGKPLMIHTRSAHDYTLEMLRSWKKEYGDKLQANIHFFTAGYDIARQYFDLDCTVSFPGVITFTSEYDETVSMSPIRRIMAETDAPYAAPMPHRGKRNSPLYVTEIYRRIAELRGENDEEVRAQLVENAVKFFGLTD